MYFIRILNNVYVFFRFIWRNLGGRFRIVLRELFKNFIIRRYLGYEGVLIFFVGFIKKICILFGIKINLFVFSFKVLRGGGWEWFL